MNARKNPPVKTTNWQAALSYRVWAHAPSFQEDAKPWKCIAAFRFLNEALDFVAYGQDNGANVLLQSPCEVKTFKASDTRAVFKASA